MSEEINHKLCHRIIEHIITRGIVFDTADLAEDKGLNEILHQYGWDIELTRAEQKLIYNDLFPLALHYEEAEIIQACFGTKNIYSLDEEIFH